MTETEQIIAATLAAATYAQRMRFALEGDGTDFYAVMWSDYQYFLQKLEENPSS